MPAIPDDQLSPYRCDPERPATQVAASKRAAETKARNAPHTGAPALINTPGLNAGVEAPATATRHRHDDQHVHGARPPPPAPLRQWVRFKELRTAGIVTNWPTLLRLIADEDFPVGRYIGPNTRVWAADEIESWLESRPVGSRRNRRHEREQEGAAG